MTPRSRAMARATMRSVVRVAWHAAWCVAVLVGAVAPASAHEPASAASDIEAPLLRTKAEYLYKFGAFVQWPATAFSSDDEPFVIGVMDGDALADELTLVPHRRRINGRGIVVRRLSAAGPLTGVHVLYLGADPADRTPVGLPLLTVADDTLDGTARGVIHFVRADGRLRFDVFLRRAEAAGLVVGARLLGVARRVDAERP
jgi:hypothetical protein